MRTWKENAHEFGALSKQGVDVRLAVLVATSVQPGNGQNVRGSRQSDRTDEKVSAAKFAEAAGIGRNRVLRHLDAWDACARKRWCAASARLAPNDADDPDLLVPTQEQFESVFDASGSGGRPRASKAEVVARAKADPVYAKDLLTAVADATPEVAGEALAENRQAFDKAMKHRMLKDHKIDLDRPVEPFPADLVVEASRIHDALLTVSTRIRALMARAEPDQQPALLRTIRQGYDRVGQDLDMSSVKIPNDLSELE
jgi:hypothetical protein